MASSSPMAKPVSPLKEIRTRLQLSQAACAAALGVAAETFRSWEAGRRPTPAAVVLRAQALTAKRSSPERLPLQVLANHFHVHVRTLRAAAHDGRLAATFGARPYFGRLTATATREAVTAFMATWYRRTYGRGRRCLVPVCRSATVGYNLAGTEVLIAAVTNGLAWYTALWRLVGAVVPMKPTVFVALTNIDVSRIMT